MFGADRVKSLWIELVNITYHKRCHDGQTVTDLIGRLDQDNCQTDRHPHNSAQKRSRTNQRERSIVGVFIPCEPTIEDKTRD